MVFRILTYKPEQGRYARGTAFWLMLALAYYGASTMFLFLSWDWARTELGFTIPVLELALTPGLLISVAAFVAMLLGLRYAINHPKLGELLIETEGELRRVTWPSWPETWNGSVVVVVTVIAMVALLAGADIVLSRFFEHVIF
ncbi:MAG: preprotein translocase subunit SecE [Planctomycetota bacterium]